MKITYIFPVILAAVLLLFFLQLPNLLHCQLPSDDKSRQKLDRKDVLFMLALCLLYGGIAFAGLGNKTSPQSFVDMGGRAALLELGAEARAEKLMLFSGVGEGSYTLEFSSDGENWLEPVEFQQNYVAVLKWNELLPEYDGQLRFIRINGNYGVYLGEVAAFDKDGKLLPLSPADDGEISAKLCDEQETAVRKQNFYNSSYFDEIYHARTAWEHLNSVSPYEISHPPLGKIIIALGIRLFGMTPFGWRFSGTFFGLLMLPIVYVFSKKMFGGRWIPAACTLLMASDFMHFVQTRIATIDTYGVFFLLLMYLFMYLYIIEDTDGDARRALLYLALSGVSFGLGAASKWTGLYAGAGLAVIWAAYRLYRHEHGLGDFIRNAIFCLVFFVLVPALIYYLSYYFYGKAQGMSGIGMFFSRDYAKIVLDNQQFMFNYHSGLVAEHPYSSKWYQWVLDIRPILYYLEYFDNGTHSSFGAYVNPALCWGGLLALFALIFVSTARRDRDAMFITAAYLAQLVPWIAVPRLTFEYHYFPCTVFLVLALGYCFRLVKFSSSRWKLLTGGFVLLSVMLFALFYPTLSGIPVDNAIANTLFGWLPTWPF